MRSLLRQKADVNAPQADGATALHWAVQLDDLEMADLLIQAGANVKAQNRFEVTPLAIACLNGSAAMIQKLVKAGADVNAPLSALGETPIMMAARTGNADAGQGSAGQRRRGQCQGEVKGPDGVDVGGSGIASSLSFSCCWNVVPIPMCARTRISRPPAEEAAAEEDRTRLAPARTTRRRRGCAAAPPVQRGAAAVSCRKTRPGRNSFLARPEAPRVLRPRQAAASRH